MIINIFGADTFRSFSYLKQTIDQFKQKRDPNGYNVVILDVKDKEIDNIVGEIKSAPFLAEKRLVVLKNILSSSDKELLAQLLILVNEELIPDSNIVVFYQSEKVGRVKEIKELDSILKKQQYSQEFALLKGVKLATWINQNIKKQAGKIDKQAIDYLIANTGEDMWYINSLLGQLAAYCADKEIQTRDVELFLGEKIDDNVFDMVEAIVSGKQKQAFKLLDEQRRLGQSDMKIFGLILWQFRVLLEMRDLYELEEGVTSDQIAKKMSIHPFVAKKNLYLVKKFTLKRLTQLHDSLLEIDYKAKTGQGDQSLLVDLFVGRI